MMEHKTNFSLLCDLLGLSGIELSKTLGVSKTYVSLWRSGARKLTKRSDWNERLAEFFLSLGEEHKKQVITALMSQVYGAASKGEMLREQLMDFLAEPDQSTTEQTERRSALYAAMLTRPRVHTPPETESNEENMPEGVRITTGIAEARQAILQVLEYLRTFNEPTVFTFICPDGIELITRDIGYAMRVMQAVQAAGERGHRIRCVLNMDFKLGDVSSFTGPWWVSHLMGFVESRYYDDLRPMNQVQMVAAIPEKIAFWITGSDYRCEIYTDIQEIERLHNICTRYLEWSKTRFHYNLFDNPNGYLSDVKMKDGDWYLFGRLPHFCIGGEKLLARMGLSTEETNYVINQFCCLFTSPAALSPNNEVYHVLCMDALEEALDKPRHMHHALQDMLHRRVYMNTQVLVDQLCEIRRLIKTHRNYNVCFMTSDVFDRIMIEICVFGWSAAVGWKHGIRSAATTYHVSSAALNGFCQVIWNSIPKPAKSGPAAEHGLDKLLGRAKKMGYTVEWTESQIC